MNAATLKTLTLAQLFDEQAKAAAETIAAKNHVAAVRQELADRFGASGQRALATMGKDAGTTTLDLQDGYGAKVEVKKTVDWDSKKLMEVARTLPFATVEKLFSIKFSVPETIYKGIDAVAPELRQQIDAARTERLSAPAVSLTKKEG